MKTLFDATIFNLTYIFRSQNTDQNDQKLACNIYHYVGGNVRAFTLLPMFRSRERADSRIQNFSSVKPSSVKNPDFLPAAGGKFLGYISQL